MRTVQPAPETEEEMYIEIMKYIDRMFNIVRPRQVLYMAIGTDRGLNENPGWCARRLPAYLRGNPADGVAPRAKMNQQRSRRFRAAQEAQDKAAAKEELLVANENRTQRRALAPFPPAARPY